jgi:hypothetical protein
VLASVPLPGARASALQFRYLFVTSVLGVDVIDITRPEAPRLLPEARIALEDARRVYPVRTYAYVAAGKDGLVILDIENPEAPKLHQRFDADGRIRDASDVKVGATNASLFAYVADGANGLQVIQLMSPETQPNFYGFSPEPRPEWIAHYPTTHPARAVSEGLHRDRAVDESGGQIAVFGRIGSRPFTLEEQRRLYLDAEVRPWTVRD